MQNSYTQVHYKETIRPYTKFPRLLCEHVANNYIKKKGGKLLDVCCGRGEFVEIFEDLGFDAYGVDLDFLVGQKNLKIKTANVDQEDLPFEENSFDVVFIKSAIEHVRNVYHLMENMSRVLKPGGKLIILTPDWKSVYKVFYDDVDHKSPFTKFSLHDLLLRYDFRNVTSEGIFYLPFTWPNKAWEIIPRTISMLVPINFSPTVRLTPVVKLLKFSREKQLIACGEKQN